MASSAPPSSAAQNPAKSLGFIATAMKRKDSFIQFFAMTGILLLSVRSLGQKYRLHDLHEDTSAVKEEQEALANRMNNIKRDLLHEASLEPTGLFASRLRLLFGEREWSHCELMFWGFLLFLVTLGSYSERDAKFNPNLINWMLNSVVSCFLLVVNLGFCILISYSCEFRILTQTVYCFVIDFRLG